MTPSLYSIAIFVHDIGRAIDFYRDKLRLPLTKQGSFGAEFLEGTPTSVSIPLFTPKPSPWWAGIPESPSSSRICCTTVESCTIAVSGLPPSRPSNPGA